jgi:DNA-binding FadR family transcriptional regulator
VIQGREEVMLALLELISASAEPIGTRRAGAALAEQGVELSESSTSRLLRDMDARGWTIPVGIKGRRLTAAGRTHLESIASTRRAGELLRRSVDVHGVQDLVDLLCARRAVESAAAADAARVASPQDVAELEAILASHLAAPRDARSSSLWGLAFHRRIASLSPNKMLRTMTDLALAPELDNVEAVLDMVLSHQQHEDVAPDQHGIVLAAVRARDPVAAEQAMYEHLTQMIGEVRAFVQGANKPMFEQLLAWASTQPRM